MPQIVDPGRQRQCANRSKRQRPACGVLSVYACARTSPTSTLSTVTAIAGAAPSIATSPWADSAESKTTTDVPLSADSEIQSPATNPGAAETCGTSWSSSARAADYVGKRHVDDDCVHVEAFYRGAGRRA